MKIIGSKLELGLSLWLRLGSNLPVPLTLILTHTGHHVCDDFTGKLATIVAHHRYEPTLLTQTKDSIRDDWKLLFDLLRHSIICVQKVVHSVPRLPLVGIFPYSRDF